MKAPTATIITGDCRTVLQSIPDASIQCCVTSPPYYGLRDYGHPEQIGMEPTPAEFLRSLVEVFKEVRRALKPDGTLWLNIGDSYNAYNGNRGASTGISDGKNGRDHPHHKRGLTTTEVKNKCMIMIPARLAIALESDGWYLRQDIIWSKPNPMPESVTDRCTKAHEYLFLLTKSERYFFDAEAIREPIRSDRGNPSQEFRNRRSVWEIPVAQCSDAHFVTYPPDLIKPCILAGSRPGDMILDPFGGSGTTGMVALELGRSATIIELNPQFSAIASRRTNVTPSLPI